MPDEPPYVAKIRASVGKNLTRIEIERLILRQWKPEFSQFPATKCPEHLRYSERIEFDPDLQPIVASGWTFHFFRYVCLLFPAVIPTPELLRMIGAIEQTRMVEGRKVINFIGSKNSGKTQFFAIIAIALVTIDAKFSRTYVSGPYKGSADAIVWGRIGTRWKQMKAAAKGDDELMHCREESSKGRYVVWPGSDEAGFIELITLDKVGKLQGAKSENPDRGWIVIICDEVAEFPTRALLDVLENLKGNENLIVITGCNFKHIEGLDGDLCRPEGKEFADLNIDRDLDWLSAYTSHTWRFDGHRASNIIAKRVIFPFLLRESTRRESENDHGLMGPKYLEQIRSFPNSSMSDYFVLTRERVRSGGGYDDFEWRGIEPTVLAFCDPGFGGDPCKIALSRFGRAFVPTTSGQDVVMNIYEATAPMTIPLVVGLKCDEEWIRRLTRVAQGQVVMKPGQDVTFYNQIAVQAAEFCLARDVPFGNFGYDGSMRAGIVQEFAAVMGGRVHAIDPMGQATDRPMPFQPERMARDECFNFVSEQHFNFAALVQAGQFRGGNSVPAGIAQICRRPWKFTGTKKQIQTKADFKEDNGGRSPDDGDVLVGGFEVALRLGFITVHSRRPDDAAYALDPLEMLRNLSQGAMMQKFGSKKLNN